jgi:hypothetical protein
MRIRLMRAAWAVVYLATPAWSQIPLGPELAVNSHTTDIQQRPAVSSDGAGTFVVVWESFGQDGSGGGVFARRYDASGEPLDPVDMQVNVYTTHNQLFPSVAADASRLVFVWASNLQDGSGWGIFGRQFDAVTGTGGPEFPVSTYTIGAQSEPSVSSDAAGNFVVVWQSVQDGDGYGVLARRFSATGTAQGPEFPVNSTTTGDQLHARVSMNAEGSFVVVWQSTGQDGSSGSVQAQRYATSGVPAGAEFQVNSYTTDEQGHPSVAIDASGRFLVAWESSTQDGDGFGVFAQRYEAVGTPVGGEFRVNSQTVGTQQYPVVASDGRAFVVVWGGFPAVNHWDAFGRRYDAQGAQGPEFRLNTFTTGAQFRASVASMGAGQFVTAWSGTDQDGHASGVFGQRFLADVIFRDGFEAGPLDASSASATDGDLAHRGCASQTVLTLSNYCPTLTSSVGDVPLQGSGAGNTLVGN